MGAVLDDIISCIQSTDRLTDDEYKLVMGIIIELLRTDIAISTELTNTIASILSDARGEFVQRYV